MKLGKQVEIEKKLDERLKTLVLQVFGQTKLLKDKKSGIMHVIIFYGFIILQFGALDIIVKGLGLIDFRFQAITSLTSFRK